MSACGPNSEYAYPLLDLAFQMSPSSTAGNPSSQIFSMPERAIVFEMDRLKDLLD